MAGWQYRKGLHDLGGGVHAWVQPDGGWNLSNAGLIADSGQAALVDTLTDVPLTQEMLDHMRASVPAARAIDMIFNTHCHPDHCAGNCLLPHAEVITSAEAAAEMRALAEYDFMEAIITHPERFGAGGEYFHEVMGRRFALRFDNPAKATRTFETSLNVKVGDRAVHLEKVGPAHTKGDTIAYLPEQKILFTGDVLFHEVHPLFDGETVGQWIAALDRLIAMDVAIVVPGHGPITDRSGLESLRDYLVYFTTEARRRFDAGMGFDDAVRDISLDAFRGWADEERIYMNLSSLYKSWGAAPIPMEEVMRRVLDHRRAIDAGSKATQRSAG